MSFPRKKSYPARSRRRSAAFIFNKPTVARPTALRPDNEDSVALEVLIPPVLPRVKQPDERAAFRIKSTQVRSLGRIAVVAGESEVFAVASSAMLGFARFLRFGNTEGVIKGKGTEGPEQATRFSAPPFAFLG